MFKDVQKNIKRTLLNLPGYHTKRKILVIESDDWGAVRMPSKQVYQDLLRKGLHVDKDLYCKYDSLATSQDLEALFDLLLSFEDKNGRNAIITANAVMANPNFEKIREHGFSNYFFEPFTETLKRNSSTHNSFELWQQGMGAGIFKPQFHGREHLYVKKWMLQLQENDKLTHVAFNMGTYGLTADVDSSIKVNYMGAFNSGLKNDIEDFNVILNEGLEIFEQLLGYKSLSFIPTTYTWHPDIENNLKKSGVKYLQGMVHQRIPLDDDQNFEYKKNNFSGHKSKSGLTYISRNVHFEPSHFRNNFDVVNDAFNAIKIAFSCQKPAVISMHRLNVIGAIDESNRTTNLELLKKLLTKVLQFYPDVEFMSSDELGDLINTK
ncbi:MAG: polysaccharide (de)acetylase [Flavobacteriaceae bacterium]|nr:polysaccharide (de)acetylase [Flavobacteriaceae bacterium]